MAFEYEKYIRKGTLPHIWCPGCGHGIVMKSLLRAIEGLKLDKNDIAVISGIGCASRLPGYLDMNTLHTTHGRALAFATGIKLANPKLKVIVVSGDGDASAIGGNHLIHAARRNIDITLLIFNNSIYGMTGGQVAPTTPIGAYASTMTYGNIDPPFDIVRLVEGAGATFVARTTSYHTAQTEQLIKQAMTHKGFAVVDIIDACPTYFGRKNAPKEAYDMMQVQKDNSIPLQIAQKKKPEELQGKIITGIFVKKEMPEYTDTYYNTIIPKAMGSK